METVRNPLGTEPIPALIRKFSIPAIISMLLNALYNIVDQIFIGQGIGMLGVAATNVAFPITTICTAVALLIGVGGASNFNLMQGRGEPERAAQVAGNSLSLLGITGIALGLLAFLFVEPMLGIFGVTDQIMPYAQPYTIIIALGVPFMVFTTGATHFIRADGSPRFAMICMVSGAVFNLIFDPIFLFVFDMGIAGIAWATTLGQVLTAMLALYYIKFKYQGVKLTKTLLRPSWKTIRMIAALGAAACFNQLAMTVVQVAQNNILRHYGALSRYGSEIPLACVGAISKVGFIYMSFAIGIAQGCQPIIGFNYGAKNYARVRQTYQSAVMVATIISTLAFLVFQLFPEQILRIFDAKGSPEYFEFGVRYIRIFLFMTFINGVQPVTSNFFTSIGKARIGMFMSLTRQIIFLLPLLLLLPALLGIDGVMYAGPIADTAAAVYALVFISREMRLMKREEQAMPAGA